MFKPGEQVLYSKRIHTSKWKLVKAEFVDYAIPNTIAVAKYNKAHGQRFKQAVLKPVAGYIKYEWEGEMVTTLSKLESIQKITAPLLAALERNL